jgi:hypothetical protein
MQEGQAKIRRSGSVHHHVKPSFSGIFIWLAGRVKGHPAFPRTLDVDRLLVCVLHILGTIALPVQLAGRQYPFQLRISFRLSLDDYGKVVALEVRLKVDHARVSLPAECGASAILRVEPAEGRYRSKDYETYPIRVVKRPCV